jgi:ketosteroid isomerase-like protein
MRLKPLLFLFLVSVPWAYSQNGVQDIRLVLDQQAAAWNNGDIDGYMQGYWKSDSLLFTSEGNVQRGWKATLEKYRKSYESKDRMGVLLFSDLEVHILSDNSGWVFGRWELRRKDDRPHGVFTLVLKKFVDGWRIVHDHTSSRHD